MIPGTSHGGTSTTADGGTSTTADGDTNTTTDGSASAGDIVTSDDLTEPTRSPAARRLLRAADDLFFRQGAVATSVREITGACGLTPGALYNHFPSKEELLFVLVERRHQYLEDQVKSALAGAGDNPVDRLAAVIVVYIRVHVRGHRGSRVANREYRNLTEERRAEVVASRRRLRDMVVAILLDGSRVGAFDIVGGTDRASLIVAAAAILDMCVHAGEWLHDGGILSMDDIEQRYVTMALRLAGAGAGAGAVPSPADQSILGERPDRP